MGAARGRHTGRWARVVALVLVVSALAVVPGAGPAGASTWGTFVTTDRVATDPSSYVTVVGDTDDPLTEGEQVLYRTDDEIWFGGRVDDTVVVRVGDPDGRNDLFELAFAPPPGETLRVGEYADVGGEPGRDGQAYLEASAGSSGCRAGPDSRLVVRDVAPDPRPIRVASPPRCGATAGVVRGEVRVDLPPATSGPVVTAQDVDWGRSFPGRAHPPQRVFLINPGPLPVSVGAPQVAAPFAVEATSCGVLLAGADCAIDLAYRPSTRDLQLGRLVLPSSVGGPIEVPLSGVGTVGQHQLAGRQVVRRLGVRDNYVVGGGDVEASAIGDRSKVHVWFDTPYADHGTPISWVQVVAPRGQQLQEGRVYTARGGGFSRPVGFNVRCTGDESASTGRFVFRELAFRADGTVAGLQLDAEERCDSGDVYAARVSWQATRPTLPFAATPLVSARPTGAVGDDREVDVTVHVPLGHGVTDTALYAVTRDGRRRLVAAGPIDPVDGSLEATTSIAERTTFVAAVVDDTGRVLQGSTAVTRLRDLGLLAIGDSLPGLVRVLRLPRGARPPVSTHLGPARGGECVRLEVQRRAGQRWVPRSRSGCRPTNARGRAVARLTGMPGALLRLRMVWAGDETSDGSVTPWRQVRYLRRR